MAFDLTGLGQEDGFEGVVEGISGVFSNIDSLVGSAGADSLKGLSGDSLWIINNAGSSYSTQERTLQFAGIEDSAARAVTMSSASPTAALWAAA